MRCLSGLRWNEVNCVAMTIPSEQSSDRDPQQLDDVELEGVTGGAGAESFVPSVGTQDDLTALIGGVPHVSVGHGGNGGVGGNGGAG